MSFSKSLRQQLSLLFKRKSFYITFLLFFFFCMFGAVTVVFNELQQALSFSDVPLDYAYIPSAATKVILYCLFNNSFIIIGVALIVCVIPFADSFFTERNSGVLQILLTKTKRSYYYISKLITTFIGNFLVYSIPLLANQLVLFAFFHKDSIAGFTGNESMHTYNNFLQINMAINPSLMDKHPYVYNILFILLFSAFMALLGCGAFCLSYYVRKYRIILLSAPLMINIVLGLLDTFLSTVITAQFGHVMPVWFALENYLMILERGMVDSPWFFLVLVAALILFIVFSTRSQCKRRDVL